MKHIPLLLLFLFASCVMPQDIEDLRTSQGSFEAAVLSDLQDLQRGVITREEYNARVEIAEEKRAREYTEIEDRIEERTAAATTAVPITGNPLVDLFLQTAGTVGVAAFGVNRYRDAKRKARNEPTA